MKQDRRYAQRVTLNQFLQDMKAEGIKEITRILPVDDGIIIEFK